ncbi:D-alanyl-D-alanine carboxypeptidase/D-alanyl-D-alanine-endopeptidase [Marinoscillum sp. MHG1-6]|uniref:D-alanyl-D-alanine carboxypeptidase/D-alanyl-D-alanine endopeptidase n=1 Tax=Marinoscillum sp. MHG1-6 TaxID=2959627 RepID=UPI0021580621|nr:D-alanyl-D-alanine carboxypeptidase/D-alanyl-D-alanine-endopeptidase [Marinoscillum sp. MHG1-6]
MIKFFIRNLMLSCFLILALQSCQNIKQNVANRKISKEITNSELLKNQFTGFSLFDPTNKEFLCHYNDHLYFTPASNTKILTAFACLSELGDSIASFTYRQEGDTIYLRPMADPTFLHPEFPVQPAIDLLYQKKLIIKLPAEPIKKYGPGWAWDDYEYSYQAERTWMPIYGNSLRIFNDSLNDDVTQLEPRFFTNYTQVQKENGSKSYIQRDLQHNIFNAWISNEVRTYERKIPFTYSNELLTQLMQDTLQTQVSFCDAIPEASDTLFSQPTREVISKMMIPSDNFLAEQLLIQCALIHNEPNLDDYRVELQNKWKSFLPDPMRWEDGSGLSRYNLITPRNLVAILNQIYDQTSWATIQDIFPIGGVSGTLKNYYAAPQPYIYAKTGTLSNNHNLSGYIKTQSGKILIFSFMNNHHLTSSYTVKMEMERILLQIRDRY